MKKNKSLIAIIMIALFLLTFYIMVSAGDGIDLEPNNNPTYAEAITFKTTASGKKVAVAVGKIAVSNDEDWYSIYLPTGDYNIRLTANSSSGGNLPADYDIYVYHYSNTSSYIVKGFSSGTTAEHQVFSVSGLQNNHKFYIKVVGLGANYNASVQYKMSLTKGDTFMLNHAKQYYSRVNNFYGRENNGSVYHTYGVSYSYGTKDSLGQWDTKIIQANNNMNAPKNNWSCYKPTIVRPGRYTAEYNAGDTGQANWAGIDCSGFIYRCSEYSSINYKIKSLGVMGCDTSQLASATYTTSVPVTELKIGDISVVSGNHVLMISRLATTFDDLYVIHADGKPGTRTIFEEKLSTERHGFGTSSLRALNEQ